MKRIFYRDLVAYDRKNGTSLVRELEMEVDAALTTSSYAVQFWRDMKLYGLKEAIAYVRNGNHGDADKIQKAADKIIEAMK